MAEKIVGTGVRALPNYILLQAVPEHQRWLNERNLIVYGLQDHQLRVIEPYKDVESPLTLRLKDPRDVLSAVHEA